MPCTTSYALILKAFYLKWIRQGDNWCFCASKLAEKWLRRYCQNLPLCCFSQSSSQQWYIKHRCSSRNSSNLKLTRRSLARARMRARSWDNCVGSFWKLSSVCSELLGVCCCWEALCGWAKIIKTEKKLSKAENMTFGRSQAHFH